MDREQFKSLPEKLRRLVPGQEAAEYGRGGVSHIAKKYNVSRTTVTKGKKNIFQGKNILWKLVPEKQEAEGKQSQRSSRKPLTDIHILKELISHTVTTAGLRILCTIDENVYTTGQTIPQSDFNALPIKPAKIISKLNYTVG